MNPELSTYRIRAEDIIRNLTEKRGDSYYAPGPDLDFIRLVSVGDTWRMDKASWDEFPEVPEAHHPVYGSARRCSMVLNMTPAEDGWLNITVNTITMYDPKLSRQSPDGRGRSDE